MSALTDKIARLRADLAAATPGPLRTSGALIETSSPQRIIAEHLLPWGKDIDGCVRQRNANIAIHVAAVNAAPTMIDVVEAAAKRPWWLDVGGAGYLCAGCSVGVHRTSEGDPRCAAAHEQGDAEADIDPCPLIPLDAALDRAEAEAAR